MQWRKLILKSQSTGNVGTLVDLSFSRIDKLFITDPVTGHSHASIITGNLEAKRLWSNANRILVENNFQPISESDGEVAQSCPTLCGHRDCSLPGSSVYGIFQERILLGVAISFSRGSSPARDWNRVSCIVGRRFTVWVTVFLVFPNFGLPRWHSGKESTCQWTRCRFNPWARKTPWKRKWQSNPVFVPGKFHGQRSLVGYRPWGSEWDTTVAA